MKDSPDYNQNTSYQQATQEQRARYQAVAVRQGSAIDLCHTIESSYSFDGQVHGGIDEVMSGTVVKQLTPKTLTDSARFKREELASRLEAEPQGITVYSEQADDNLSLVYTAQGALYQTSAPPRSAPGTLVVLAAPMQRDYTVDELQRLLAA